MTQIKKHREMSQKERIAIFFLALFIFPIITWFFTFQIKYGIPKTIDKKDKLKYIWFVFEQTFTSFNIPLLLAIITPIIFIFLIGFKSKIFRPDVFTGQKFDKFLRGTQLVTPEYLSELTKSRDKENYQIEICNIPIPIELEGLHFLENGSTGTGKSVGIKEVKHHIKIRQFKYRLHNTKLPKNKTPKTIDRSIVIDPNGDLFSKFGNPNRDKILNPYDIRTEKWSIYNEIIHEYDFNRVAMSIVPESEGETEKWRSYARTLLISVMKYVRDTCKESKPSMRDVFHIATILEPEKLKNLMKGYEAESMFVAGAEKALGSARFTLADRLPSILLMPEGDFSIREFLNDNQTGDLYITWREDQIASLKPLITTFADIFITTILSMSETKVGCYGRSIWLFLDELASMDEITSLRAGLEKGRKHGLKIFAGCQTIKQIISIYGENKAYILLSNFKNLLVLGGAKTDPETSEFMSKAIGDMEILREKKSRSSGNSNSTTTELVKYTERAVTASEITSIPVLYVFIAFAENTPVTRAKLMPYKFENRNIPIIEKEKSDINEEVFE